MVPEPPDHHGVLHTAELLPGAHYLALGFYVPEYQLLVQLGSPTPVGHEHHPAADSLPACSAQSHHTGPAELLVGLISAGGLAAGEAGPEPAAAVAAECDLATETRGMALFILVAKSALHCPRVPRWVHLASEAPSNNSP